MCGIIGIVDYENSIDRDILDKMCKIIAHRGPDDQGIYIDKNIGLGHRRLSIIDLSKAGHQPMCNEDGSIWITYNGEIYNFKELRNDLEKKGHRFKSDTDTEVIIHAYEEYSEDCLKLFNGMFAFGIWDSNKKQLFLARDRIGQKPLVYYVKNNLFIFGSEIKSLVLHPGFKKKINFDAISHYLTFQYIPHPLTVFEDCFKLSPGHYLIYRNNEINIKEYWDLNYEAVNKPEDYFEKEIIKHLDRSTKVRLMSDVPLGAFLSGGIDSSAVVAFMSKYIDRVKTFSIGFDYEEYDETKYARIVAEKFNTEHHEFIVKADMSKILPKLAWVYDEPFGDKSALPTFFVSKLAKKYVTVVLSGDAGDENFAGYNRYDIIKEKSYEYKPFHFLPEEKNKLFNVNFRSRVDSREILMRYYNKFNDKLNKLTYSDIKLYLPDCLMNKIDIASMVNSLEVRSPFLDFKFMEFAAKIPPNIKLKNCKKKYILKRALRKYLPKKILYREKMGFGIPLEPWFGKDLKSYISDVLMNKESFSNRYFNINHVKKIIDNNVSFKLWNLLMLEKWFELFSLEKKPII